MKHYEQPQYLTFEVSGDEYAAAILQVREIIEYSVVTRVPTAPAPVRGVINLRGSVVPVVDLAMILGLPPTVVSRWSCIVVVEVTSEGEEMVIGVLVDAMGRVIDLPPDRIEKPPSFGTRARIDCLRGLGNVDDKLLLILDLDKVLGQLNVADAAKNAAMTDLAAGARAAEPLTTRP